MIFIPYETHVSGTFTCPLCDAETATLADGEAFPCSGCEVAFSVALDERVMIVLEDGNPIAFDEYDPLTRMSRSETRKAFDDMLRLTEAGEALKQEVGG